ncbi:hypothetical protein [Roseivirga sp.]|uniref:hypothetical protein n=1 Tax=Roseivirga sp. TaxID=1964215 RepID=UPI003B8DC280
MQILSKSKAGRYIIYAVGEILLVIIGIMIAVWLNNINEARIQDKKIQATLDEIQEELLVTVADANDIIEFYNAKDSLIYLVMSNQLTEADYKDPKNWGLALISLNYSSLSIQDDGFKNLMSKTENMSKRYSPLVKRLKRLHVHLKTSLESNNEKMNKAVEASFQTLQNNQDWFSEDAFFQKWNSDNMVNYFLNDPNHKNSLYTYSNLGIGNLTNTIYNIRIESIKAIYEIDSLLNRKNNYPFDLKIEDFISWTGTYTLEKNSFSITSEGHQLFYKKGSNTMEIYPLGNGKFHIKGPGFYQVLKQKDGSVSGIKSSGSNINDLYKKAASTN